MVLRRMEDISKLCRSIRVVQGREESNRWFAAINFSSAQATLRRLDKAFANFFRRVKAGEEPGYPRFKGRDRFNSVLFPSHGDGIRLKGNKLRVQHVGTIRVCLHREVEGNIKTFSLKREADKWFLVVTSDMGDIATVGNILPAVGLDVGFDSLRYALGRREDQKPSLP
jgi:putative transposase